MKIIENPEAHWTELISDKLVGKKIVDVQYVTQDEVDDQDWSRRPIAIQLDDGNWLVPMSDDEGNDGGSITTTFEDLQVIPVLWE